MLGHKANQYYPSNIYAKFEKKQNGRISDEIFGHLSENKFKGL